MENKLLEYITRKRENILVCLIRVIKYGLRSGAIAPNAFVINDWDWELEKTTFNFNHQIKKY